HRQVVVMTAPHIGNTGVNGEDDESRKMWVAGFVVRDPARRPSNWRSTGSLDDQLAQQGVAGISGIDTRALTRHLRARAALRVETHVLPSPATAEELLAAGPDGVFLSGGPGDPAAADYAVEAVKGVLDARRPLFGICFGNQILGRALGLGTYKLRFGHRGLNQPVLDRVSGTVRVTSHNHGFAVDAPLDRPTDTPYGPVEVSHVGLNDDVVEGLRLLEAPAFSVQFHPEAAAGPHDAAPLFQRFVDLMEETQRAQAH